MTWDIEFDMKNGDSEDVHFKRILEPIFRSLERVKIDTNSPTLMLVLHPTSHLKSSIGGGTHKPDASLCSIRDVKKLLKSGEHKL